MRILKRILIGSVVFVVLVVALFLLLIGPWPTYTKTGWENATYHKNVLAAIEQNTAESEITDTPGRLQAGWGKQIMTPEVGMPLGGYGARISKNEKHPEGNISTGVRDQLYVKAIAFSDGVDTAVLVGSDMLIVPPNIADAVREEVGKQTPLTPNNILLNSSHTHCGPGGFGPGLAAYFTGGGYDPEIPKMIANAFTAAIVEAYNNLEPAKLANGEVQAPEYIRNRVRGNDAPEDSELSWMVVEQDDGDRCYVIRYSAHPTTFGDGMMQFSAEFPGEARKYIQDKTRGEAIYLGGATGSMGPNAPQGATADERVTKMGQALGQLVVEATQELKFKDHLDVVSVGTAMEMPQLQVRPIEANPGLRVSPFARFIVGMPIEMWVQGVRLGDVLFVGMPYDFSGEVSIQWAAKGRAQGIDVWVTGFSGAYGGYLSPDKYYMDTPLEYEIGLMNWFGPEQEAQFNVIFQHLLDVLGAKALPEAEAVPETTANG